MNKERGRKARTSFPGAPPYDGPPHRTLSASSSRRDPDPWVVELVELQYKDSTKPRYLEMRRTVALRYSFPSLDRSSETSYRALGASSPFPAHLHTHTPMPCPALPCPALPCPGCRIPDSTGWILYHGTRVNLTLGRSEHQRSEKRRTTNDECRHRHTLLSALPHTLTLLTFALLLYPTSTLGGRSLSLPMRGSTLCPPCGAPFGPSLFSSASTPSARTKPRCSLFPFKLGPDSSLLHSAVQQALDQPHEYLTSQRHERHREQDR